MKSLMCSLILLAPLLSACSTNRQDANTELYDATVSEGVAAQPQASYRGEVKLGPGRDVPVNIQWTAGRDAAGCLKVVDLKVARTGGDPAVVISDVKHDALPGCVAQAGSADGAKYQTVRVSLKYRTRQGLQRINFAGVVATLQGDGNFKGI